MPNSKDLDPTKSPWDFFGNRLRRLREAKGLSQGDLGGLVFQSHAYISQLETAARIPELELVERIDAALDANGDLVTTFRMAKKAQEDRTSVPEYFAAVADLEKVAQRIDWFADSLFPGLLQTSEYAEALIRKSDPFRSEEAITTLIADRMDRSSILGGTAAPRLTVVLDESALRRVTGGREVMAAQLSHTVQMARTRRVVVQVVPFSEGAHPLVAGQLIIMHFADTPPIAYQEGPHGGQVLEKSTLTDAAMLSYHLTCAAALSPERSLELMESVAEEYRK
ncbi:helix-turn-helix transcriptional regulator [Streptomyces sp. NPDC047525]|uniref:helix-turn-helix domain-containing protein n=1 Tax=Streptomyces sp. NPDC047525 TaxID=3155264 RepID=UPI0033CDA5B8